MSDLPRPQSWQTLFVPGSLRSPPSGPSECPHLDFIQLPLGMGDQCVLVTICVFSRCADALPCHKADILIVAKKLLESMFPTWGLPSIISGDQGAHVTGALTNTLQTSWDYHCLITLQYHAKLRELRRALNLECQHLQKPLYFHGHSFVFGLAD